MITVRVSHKPLWEEKAQVYGILYSEETHKSQEIIKELTRFYKPLEELMREREFTGAAKTSLLIVGQNEVNQPVYIVLAGLGVLSTLPINDRVERLRRATGRILRSVENFNITQLAIQLPDPELLGVKPELVAQEITATAFMTDYHFDLFITDKNRKQKEPLVVTLVTPEFLEEQVKFGVERGQRIGYAVNQARQWCDLPGNIIHPASFAEHAKRVAQTHNLSIKVFDEKDIIDMNMGGIYAVAKGSVEKPRFIILEYKTDDPEAPTLALVGKGVTFDSGGLSLKPARSMETMKDDMAGAAAVVSAIETIAHLKPKINVIAAAPLVENMPSGTATRPGDIIRFYNGKTAEVKNTDAEGRLILADALSYVVKNYHPDMIITIATLTGSCAQALGPFFAGLMSQHPEVAKRIEESGERSGDRVWPLPFDNDYKPAIQSDVADICNIGNDKYCAGAITAGFFLQNFVDLVPWAHLDIAGTAFNVPDRSYYRPGATGFGVRLFIDLIEHLRDLKKTKK